MRTTLRSAARRGSFVETMRMFACGKLWWLVLLGFAVVALASVPARSPAHYFFAMGAMVGIWFAGSTLMIEEMAASRLAFLTLVPQPIENKWLVLAPNCLGAIAPAAVQAAFGKLPAVSGLPMLGCALWTVGAVRLLRPYSALFVFPAVAAAPIAAWRAYCAGGWGAASAAALALGLGALAFQRPVVFDVRSTPRPASVRARLAVTARASYDAVSRVGRERGIWLKSAVRFLLVCTASMRRSNVVMFVMMVLVVASQALPGLGLFMLVITLPTGPISNTYSGEMFEFLRPTPFSRGQRFVGGVVIPVLIAVCVPLLMMTYVDIDYLNRDGLTPRWITAKYGHATTLSYLRDVVGATFLPGTWPAGGLSKDLWPRLRPLLWLDLLRVIAIVLASLFGGAHLRGARPRGRWLVRLQLLFGFAIQMTALFATLRLWGTGEHSFPIPPIWFALLLAALAIANWTWQARAVNRPGAATGSSTRG